MANVIKLKRGTSTPTTSDIVDGEVAIDKSAKKLYLNDGGTVKEIGGGGGLESDAQENTVAGTNAGDSFTGTDAEKNTLYGFNAGTAITTSDNNTLIGHNCGAAITTTSTVATGVGFEALKTATGHNLTAFGRRALYSHTASNENDGANAAFGSLSQYLNVSGGKNSSFGNNTLQNLTTGDENTCVGYQAGQNTTTGSRNTFIGKGAGNGGGGATGDNNICIGYEVDPVFGESNTVTIGDSNITKFKVPGINVVLKDNGGTPTQGDVLTVDANGEASFAAASGGGSLTLISSTTFTSAVSAITFTSISGYTQYKIIFNLQTSGAGTLEMRVGIDGTYDSGTNYVGPAADTSILILGGFSATSKHGEINIFDLNQAESTMLYALGVGLSNDETSANHQSSGGKHNTATAQNCIQLFGSSGNISSGTVSLYGIATS